jgi:cyclopropane-fatty-acyl-phospholipid synthase
LENFIDRYVFPGGYLPSIPRLLDAIHKGSKGSLEVDTVQSIGPHYAKALRLWRENLLANWDVIKEDYRRGRGGDEKDLEAFRRRWVWYFSYCEAGFREGILGDSVVVARRRPSEEERAGVPL